MWHICYGSPLHFSLSSLRSCTASEHATASSEPTGQSGLCEEERGGRNTSWHWPGRKASLIGNHSRYHPMLNCSRWSASSWWQWCSLSLGLIISRPKSVYSILLMTHQSRISNTERRTIRPSSCSTSHSTQYQKLGGPLGDELA